MKTLHLIFAAMLLILSLSSCDKNKDNETTSCDKTVIISDDLWHGETQTAIVNEAVLNGNCLDVNFTFGACNPESRVIELIAMESVFDSLPPKRQLRISVEQPGADCLGAFSFTYDMSFDVSDCQLDGDAIVLLLEGIDNILYDH